MANRQHKDCKGLGLHESRHCYHKMFIHTQPQYIQPTHFLAAWTIQVASYVEGKNAESQSYKDTHRMLPTRCQSALVKGLPPLTARNGLLLALDTYIL